VEAKLASGDWKKEKVHVLKKPDQHQGIQPGQKKQKKNRKAVKKPEDNKLTLTIETLSYFDQIKVSPPSYSKEIDETIKQLNEKKEYFTKMSDDLNDGKKPEAAEKKADESDKKETNSEDGEKKAMKGEKKQKKSAVKMDDEDMFPSLGA